MNKLAIRTTSILAAMTAVVILAFAMVMTVSAQSDDPDWKVAPTGLERSRRRCGRRAGPHLGRPPPDHQDPVRLPSHLDA